KGVVVMNKLYLRKVDKNSYLPKRSKLTLTHSQKQQVKNIDIMSVYPYTLSYLPKINYNITKILKLRNDVDIIKELEKKDRLLEEYEKLTTHRLITINNLLDDIIHLKDGPNKSLTDDIDYIIFSLDAYAKDDIKITDEIIKFQEIEK